MVRRDGAEVRKERIQEIARLIHRSLHTHGELSLSKTLATIQYEFGLTRDKIQGFTNTCRWQKRPQRYSCFGDFVQ
jgi:hypothetical protein